MITEGHSTIVENKKVEHRDPNARPHDHGGHFDCILLTWPLILPNLQSKRKIKMAVDQIQNSTRVMVDPTGNAWEYIFLSTFFQFQLLFPKDKNA